MSIILEWNLKPPPIACRWKPSLALKLIELVHIHSYHISYQRGRYFTFHILNSSACNSIWDIRIWWHISRCNFHTSKLESILEGGGFYGFCFITCYFICGFVLWYIYLNGSLNKYIYPLWVSIAWWGNICDCYFSKKYLEFVAEYCLFNKQIILSYKFLRFKRPCNPPCTRKSLNSIFRELGLRRMF